jgi:amidase
LSLLTFQAYLARVSEVNSELLAITEINPDALSIAASLDAERANGTVRGPLHGIPMFIKNNIATADAMNNTAGSYALLGAKVPRDSTMAAKLRQAGVVLLGKANLSQWANFRSNNSTSGWSAYGGQCTGAYYPQMDPSGSSSGSAVSTSIGLCLAALGTETDGSIISPSSSNNLVGIKPTVGLTSRSLVIPISEHQDTVGPIARTVRDAAYILQAIAGVDPFDNYTSAIPGNGTLPDYVAACSKFANLTLRIGVPRNILAAYLNGTNTSAPVVAAFEDAIVTLKSIGANITDPADISALDDFIASNNETTVLDADFISNLATYLSELTFNPNNVTSLADVRNFTQYFPAEDYPDRDTGVWDAALAMGFNNTDIQAWEAYQADLFLGGAGGVIGALDNNDLDVLILPTDFASTAAAIAGLPVVTVPLGFYPSNSSVVKNSRGLVEVGPGIPFGLSFLGRKWSETTLITAAYAFEQATRVRDANMPMILPTTEIVDVLSA